MAMPGDSEGVWAYGRRRAWGGSGVLRKCLDALSPFRPLSKAVRTEAVQTQKANAHLRNFSRIGNRSKRRRAASTPEVSASPTDTPRW